MKIEHLTWDTDFFGFNIGRVIVNDENEFDPISFKEQAINEDYGIVYIFKYFTMLSWKKVIEADLEMVDIMLTMSKKIDKTKYQDIPYNFRTELSNKELSECYFIAEQTAIVSRFYKEELIGPNKTKELYRKWIDNALNNTFSDGILLEKDNETIIGIHLIKESNKIGNFTLTGVDPNYKRMGIGNKLWSQSFGLWGKESEVETIRSPFSFQNNESLNFHLKMGFNKLEETKYIYHFRNNNINL